MTLSTKKLLAFGASATVMVLPMLVGAQFNPTAGQADSNLPTTSVTEILLTVMQWLLGILTVIAVLGFIVSGILYITAAGTGKQDTAKEWFTNSLMGIFVALIGYIIIRLINNLLRGNEAGA